MPNIPFSSPDDNQPFTDVASYTPGGVYLQPGRAIHGGSTPALITAIAFYVGKYTGGSMGMVFSLGSISTGVVSVAGYTAPSGSCSGLHYGGTVQSTVSPTSATQYRFGRGGGGTTYDTDGYSWWGSLAGAYHYVQAPTAPLSPNATPNPTAGEATVTWATPSDNGETAITGYRVWYGTSPTLVGASYVDVGVVTSSVLTGLTPGQTYYFAVSAKNAVTNAAGGVGVRSSIVSALLGTVPGAPTALAATAVPGAIGLTWTTPASDGGVPILDYTLEYATNGSFTGAVTVSGLAGNSATVADLTPGTTYYFRVKARNSVGLSAASSSANATVPARTYLDIVDGASVTLSNGTQVSIRSDGASNPTLTLGYSDIDDGTTWTSIGVIPDGTGATDFATPGGIGGLALVDDPNGNLFVIGRQGSNPSAVLVRPYLRTGSANAWTVGTSLAQALPSTGNPLATFAAAYAGGSTPSILVLARRAGGLGVGALSYATLDVAALLAGTGSLFLASGSDPSWLSTPPTGAPANSATLDITPLVPGGTRLAIAANGFAVVDVSAGVVGTVVKSAAGTALAGKVRVVPVSATAFALLSTSAGALSIVFYSVGGSILGSASVAGVNAWGGAFSNQWDAFYNPVTGSVRIYYVADDSARKVERVDVSATTFAVAALVVVTSTLGAASSTNGALRLPRRFADERRVLVEAGNLLSGTQSLASYDDRGGNVAPSAPALVTRAGFDATQAALFQWTFGDSNPRDLQAAFQLQIQRVSDSVDVHDTGKVTSATSSRTVAGAVLTNGVNYRWRVRTYDALDTVGAWSSYGTFTTTAAGTLVITDPAADNAFLEESDRTVTWAYSNTNGATQVSYRLKVIRTSDSAVLLDTGVVTSTATSRALTGLVTGVEVRVEVFIVNTGAVTSPTATRLITPDYGTPMTPVLALSVEESGVLVAVTNPAPTGDRPEVTSNEVYRRELGAIEWTRIAIVGYGESYFDRTVRSGRPYEYQVRGVSA